MTYTEWQEKVTFWRNRIAELEVRRRAFARSRFHQADCEKTVGQLMAAERCLDEVYKMRPDCDERGCDHD